jgi:hypothetical protein
VTRISAHTASRLAVAFTAATAIAAFTACTTDDVVAPPTPVAGTFTLDATSRWVYVSLADSAIVAPTPSANESSAWDIAFNATNVTLNGGAAGPGGVTGACVCQNAAATNAEILAMTPSSELADFDAVSSVPASLTFTNDVLTPAVSGWYTGSGSAAVADPTKSYLVRLSDSLSYAKVRVTRLESPSAISAGRVTLEYAVQPSATAAFGSVRTMTVDLTTTGAKSVDLNAGTLSNSATDWDLRLDGFTVRVNGGVSGAGKGAATPATDATGGAEFDKIISAAIAPQSFRSDVYAGVFGTNRYYRYNITGNNRISPTFDVYLLKRGNVVYKLQILDYYNETGQPRFITFRYAQIAGS